MTVRLNLIQETLLRSTLSWFGHSYVSGCSIHWTGIHYGIVISECRHKICKYLLSLNINYHLLRIIFRKQKKKTDEKKGYVKSILS